MLKNISYFFTINITLEAYSYNMAHSKNIISLNAMVIQHQNMDYNN